MEKRLTFCHPGTFGDTIYGMCAVKILGGGDVYIKLNAMNEVAWLAFGMVNAGVHAGRYTQSDLDFLFPLLEHQSYIHNLDVWRNETVDYDLGTHYKFTTGPKGWQGNQTECYGLAMGWDIYDPVISNKLNHEPWLTPVEPLYVPGRYIAVHRADRYNYNGDPSSEWSTFIEQGLSETGFFLGTDKEHAAFEQKFGIKIYHQKVKDLLEMAKYIQGCELFVGNQSIHNSIAIGLGKSYWLEIRKDYEHTITRHGYGDNWFPRINGYNF